MKILVCIDGSEHSYKAVDFAIKLTGSCNIDQVSIIHVYENTPFLPNYWQGKYPFSAEEKKRLQELDKRMREDRKAIFAGAVERFERANISPKTVFKVGHPAEMIAAEATEGGYDLVVIGRRGQGGVKNLFMGSVSSTVLQTLKSNVLIVK